MSKQAIDKELLRQMFHLALGFLIIIILMKLGRNVLMAACFFALVIGTLIINQLLLGRRMGFIDGFIKYFERDKVIFPGWGSSTYIAGVLILVTALENTPEIIAGIFILAVGDSFSTTIGRYCKTKWPHNKRKTIEGSITFFVTSLPAYFFIGPVIFPIAFVAALVESFEWPLDDNLIIPIACGIMFMIL